MYCSANQLCINASSAVSKAKPDEPLAWDDLRVVLAIARGSGLAGAARTLRVNHSSVYRRLDALEARLQVRLFERGARCTGSP